MLSVVIITRNEEHNLGRALASVRWADECVVVDACSTDRTVEIAKQHGARVFVRPWQGFTDQRNWALQQAAGGWILPLDADEEVTPELAAEIRRVAAADDSADGYWIPRKNLIFGRWMRHGGYWPDLKLRLFRRGRGRFEDRPVHEGLSVEGRTGKLANPLLHYAYPTLSSYLDTINRYSSLGAAARGTRGFSVVNIILRPLVTFLYNYFFRLGFLDGREGLLLHLYHAGYVSWTYAKAWERGRVATPAPTEPRARAEHK